METPNVKQMKKSMKKFNEMIDKLEQSATNVENDYQFRFNRPGFEKDISSLFSKNIQF